MFTSSHQWSAAQTAGREEGDNLQWEMSGNAIIKQHTAAWDQGLLGLHAEFKANPEQTLSPFWKQGLCCSNGFGRDPWHCKTEQRDKHKPTMTFLYTHEDRHLKPIESHELARIWKHRTRYALVGVRNSTIFMRNYAGSYKKYIP